MLLGSCFADEVGARLADRLPEGQVRVNPFGVLYNPDSIAQAIQLLMMDAEQRRAALDSSLFLARDGRWHSWLYGTKLTATSREECLSLCLKACEGGQEATDLLVITLGTDRCYRLKADGRVVANCHKEPSALFDECADPHSTALPDALRHLLSCYPSMRVVMTVSPYRYAKYGFHESQLSKARLLLLTDSLCHELPNVTYFPAYELLLDELRDYRFYASDMLHPSEQAADYVFERFEQWCFTPELVASANERLRELKRSRHCPIRG